MNQFLFCYKTKCPTLESSKKSVNLNHKYFECPLPTLLSSNNYTMKAGEVRFSWFVAIAKAIILFRSQLSSISFRHFKVVSMGNALIH